MSFLSSGDLLGLAGVYGYVAAVIALSWALRNRVDRPRKIVHVGAGGIVFFWWMFESNIVMAGLAALPFVPILLLATPRSPVRFLRDSPLGDRSSEGHTYGLVLYAVSWTIIAFFLFDDLFAASVAIAAMSFGDGFGEIVGRRFGKHKYMPDRSLEGSLAVFLATAASIIVLSWFYFTVIAYSGSTAPFYLIPFSLTIGGLVALIEGLTPGSIDNLVIPLLVAGLLHGMGV